MPASRSTTTAAALVVAAALVTPGAARAAGLQVVATTTDLAAIAREVGGDLAEVTAIAAGDQDPHFVDAKPSYLLKLQRADLFVAVGLELEIGWAPTLLTNVAQRPHPAGRRRLRRRLRRHRAAAGADRRRPDAGDIHPYGNPHYWLDPANGHVDRAQHRRRPEAGRCRTCRRLRRAPRRLRPPAGPGAGALAAAGRAARRACRWSRTTTRTRTSSALRFQGASASSSRSRASRRRAATSPSWSSG